MIYYTAARNLQKRYDTEKRSFAFCAQSIAEHQEWKANLRKRLTAITGIDKCVPTAPNAIKLSRHEEKDYVLECWTIDTEPELTMPFYLFRPHKPNGAAMIVAHGHGGGKEAAAGIMELPNMQAHKDFLHQPVFARLLASHGYTVACPDARGSGQRRELHQQGDTAEARASCSHRELLQVYLSFGQSLVGVFTWDLMRLVDFLETLPEVDPKHIGCSGMSGGGQQTLWLAAMDERIRTAITSGYFYGQKEALLMQPGNCACNFVPHLYETCDMGDLAALIAPRPFFIESGKTDGLNGAPGLNNVYPQVETARKAYELYDASERLIHSVHPYGHQWVGEGMLEFVEKYL